MQVHEVIDLSVRQPTIEVLHNEVAIVKIL